MSIDLLGMAHEKCLSLLMPASAIDEEMRSSLAIKITTVVSHALDPYIFIDVANILRIDELKDLPHDHAIRLLASRIFKCVLSDTPDIAKQLAKVLKKNLDQRKVRFAIDPDPAKEGRAKKYERESEAALAAKPPAFLYCLTGEAITEDILVEAFMNDFEIYYLQINEEGHFTRQAFALLSECFREALEETAQEVLNETLEPAQGVEHFYQSFNKRYPRSEYREMISRDTFRYLAGEHIEGGIGPKTPLNVHDLHIQALIGAYENGSWKEEKERELVIIKQIPQVNQFQFLSPLRSLVESAQFISVLTQYFESLLV